MLYGHSNTLLIFVSCSETYLDAWPPPDLTHLQSYILNQRWWISLYMASAAQASFPISWGKSTTMTRSNASFTLSPGEQLFGKVHQGHVNWGDMKDMLHEVNKYQKGPFPPFSCLTPPAHFSASIYSSGGEKEGTVKGLYTPHSWKLIGLFTTQCPACEKMQ